MDKFITRRYAALKRKISIAGDCGIANPIPERSNCHGNCRTCEDIPLTSKEALSQRCGTARITLAIPFIMAMLKVGPFGKGNQK